MKIDPAGKAKLESLLLGMHPPGPLRQALVHESGELATVQIADKYFRYRLMPTAKKILHGQIVPMWENASELFALMK
jgi:hypothetical protein